MKATTETAADPATSAVHPIASTSATAAIAPASMPA
jgi:hypothetical protein